MEIFRWFCPAGVDILHFRIKSCVVALHEIQGDLSCRQHGRTHKSYTTKYSRWPDGSPCTALARSSVGCPPDILTLKHVSRILGHCNNPALPFCPGCGVGIASPPVKCSKTGLEMRNKKCWVVAMSENPADVLSSKDVWRPHYCTYVYDTHKLYFSQNFFLIHMNF